MKTAEITTENEMEYCPYCGEKVKLGQEWTSDNNGHAWHASCYAKFDEERKE